MRGNNSSHVVLRLIRRIGGDIRDLSGFEVAKINFRIINIAPVKTEVSPTIN